MPDNSRCLRKEIRFKARRGSHRFEFSETQRILYALPFATPITSPPSCSAIDCTAGSNARKASEPRATFVTDIDDLNFRSTQAFPCRRNLWPPVERVSGAFSDSLGAAPVAGLLAVSLPFSSRPRFADRLPILGASAIES